MVVKEVTRGGNEFPVTRASRSPLAGDMGGGEALPGAALRLGKGTRVLVPSGRVAAGEAV